MRLTFIMSVVKNAKPPLPERVSSGSNRLKPKGAPLRAFHPNSSPVYKTQSDSALTARVSNLTIKDNQANTTVKRTVFGRGSGNQSVKSLSDVASLLQNEAVKNVVIVAGAGISTPSGIPDFRSPGTGLYDNLQQYSIPYPEAIFDIDYFHQNPRPFFTLAKELYPSGKYRPNYLHYFVRHLYDKEILLRMYTQNIDGLERLAGIPAEKLVEAHGTFSTATCTICRNKVDGSQIKEKIFSDKLPRCPNRGCVGIMKPDIVFFGEDLPRKFYSYMKDMLQTDLVLVMGTSLEVQPFAGIIDTVRYDVPRVLFNRDAVGPFRYSRRIHDVVAPGDLITSMQKFVKMTGWETGMVDLITKEEGEFKVETRKDGKKKRSILPTVKEALEPNPTANPNNQNNKTSVQRNNQKNYNNIINGQNSNIKFYRFRESDSSTSESETETETSSDESSEEDRKRRPVIRRNNRSFNSLGNGGQKGGNLRNGFRSKSATKPDPTNNKKIHTWADKSFKGRSSVGNLSGRSVKSESGINDTLAKRRIDNKKLKPLSTSISNIKKGAEEIERIERDKVLKKYGINPNSKSPYANIDKSIVKKDKPFRLKDTYVKKRSPVENDKLNTEGMVETQIERDKQLETVSDTIVPPDAKEERPVFFIGDSNNADGNKLNYEEAEKESADVRKGDINSFTLRTANNGHSECNMANIIDRESKYETEVGEGNVQTSNETLPVKISKKIHENADNKFEKISQIVNDENNQILPPPTDYKDKIFQLRKLAAREKDRDRIERMKMLEKSRRPKILNSLNTKPYGYATKLNRPLQQGVGPFHRTNIRTLNSTMDRSDSMHRSGSADLPKISYRHRLQSTSKPNINLNGFKTPENDGSDECGSSEEEFR